MSSTIRTMLLRNNSHLDLIQELPSQPIEFDASIDDPVNDTGLGPRRGDLQVSVEVTS